MKKYSATENAFYDTDINVDIPSDATEISDEEWKSMLTGQSEGQVITAGADGKPSLTDRVMTDDEKIAKNVAQKNEYRGQADEAIAPLQDAADLEIATDDETASLKLWKHYRVTLSRIDANTLADITWPEQPE